MSRFCFAKGKKQIAIYGFSAKVIKRSKGRSATAAAAYRAGENLKCEKSGQTHRYKNKSGVDHTEIFRPEGAPEWNRSELWNQVEAKENRKDAQLAREVTLSLPRELGIEQQKQLVSEFVSSEFVTRGMIADTAIHNSLGNNPHCHVMLTMRSVDENGFGKKNRDWNAKPLLENWRVSWGEHANKALQRAGSTERITHLSLKARGINRLPQPKLGPNVKAMEARGIRTRVGAEFSRVQGINRTLISLQNLERESYERGIRENGAAIEAAGRKLCTVAEANRRGAGVSRSADRKQRWRKAEATENHRRPTQGRGFNM